MSSDLPSLADPERALAVVHAAAAARPGLHALFALDERLGGVVGTTGEPGIGLIRLAWWREALERLDAAPPPAEPLLGALAAHVVPTGVAGTTLAGIEDGWAALLDGEPDAAALTRHGLARGGGLFGAAAMLLGLGPRRSGVPDEAGIPLPSSQSDAAEAAPPRGRRDGSGRASSVGVAGCVPSPAIAAAGAGWALADLAHRHSVEPVRVAARAAATAALAAAPIRWPRPLRPLGMLTALARADAVAPARTQGSPGRVARMLAMRLTGR